MPWDDEHESLPRQTWQQPRYDPAAHQRRLENERRAHARQPGYAQPYSPQGQPWPQPGNGQPPFAPQYAPQAQFPQQSRGRKRHTARNVIVGIGGLIVGIVVIAVVANSGNHTISTSGTSGGRSTGGSGGAAAKTAGIGSAITLSGNENGEQVAVTVTKVISSASPGDEFTSAPAGDRLYAVQFRLRDTGSAAYSDAPSNGAVVVDSAGQSYQPSIADTAAGCIAFPALENIASGASGLGCIVFEVPKVVKITQVQFTLDSGMGPQTGQWSVAP